MLIAVKAVVMVGAFMFGFFVLANSDLIKKNLVSAFGAKIMTISAIVLVLVLTPVGLFMGLFNFVMIDRVRAFNFLVWIDGRRLGAITSKEGGSESFGGHWHDYKCRIVLYHCGICIVAYKI